ncbi:hypothetical protein ACNO8S_13655 [Haloarcula sp. KBTZ06]|uniref:hypothetical protein n=1 Tax=Haloarcula sp. KBTZ06 TaxID=3402682 RepID=UPI003B436BFE
MAVIVRERHETGDGIEYRETYRTDKHLTDEARAQAEELDALLESRMKAIEQEMESEGLLKLVNSSGVIQLWYEVGQRLDFVFDPSVVSPEDREDVLRALYDHTAKLWPGEEIPRRANRATENHFWYCYQLAQYEWELVEQAGNWTIWVEFFDTELMQKDERIIRWLAEVQEQFDPSARQNWVREINRELRNVFESIDTRILSDEELREELNEVLEDVHGVSV